MRILILSLVVFTSMVAEAGWGWRRNNNNYYVPQQRVIYQQRPVQPAMPPAPQTAPVAPSLNVSSKESFEAFVAWANLCLSKTEKWKEAAGERRLARDVVQAISNAEAFAQEALAQVEKGQNSTVDSVRLYHGNLAARNLVKMAGQLEKAVNGAGDITVPSEKAVKEMISQLKSWGPRLPISED